MQSSSSNSNWGSHARLEITCQPESKTYKDEGGKRSNYLFVFYVLRCGPQGLPPAVVDLMQRTRRTQLPLTVTLRNKSGEFIHSRNDIEFVGEYNYLKKKNQVFQPYLDMCTFRGCFRYKINVLSKPGLCLYLSLSGVDEGIVGGCLSHPTCVLSKRKWFRESERVDENLVRDHVEQLAAQYNETLSMYAQYQTAKYHFSVGIRDLYCVSDAHIEFFYPILSSRPRKSSSSSSTDDSLLASFDSFPSSAYDPLPPSSYSQMDEFESKFAVPMQDESNFAVPMQDKSNLAVPMQDESNLAVPMQDELDFEDDYTDFGDSDALDEEDMECFD